MVMRKIQKFIHNNIVSVDRATKRKPASIKIIVDDSVAEDILNMILWLNEMSVEDPPLTSLRLCYEKKEN